CMNRRALSEELEAELDRARRYNLALTILLADIDRFKLVNDTRGHIAGDSVLRQVGEILRREVRSVDQAARYGGEEFVVVMPDTARFCARDGNMLVEVQSKAATTAAAPGAGTAARTPSTPKPGLERASSLSGHVLDSRYQVQKKLGEGGMSYVYLAREVASGQDVAIKVLSPKLATDRSSVERLRREAGLAMRLDHPNVCRIL